MEQAPKRRLIIRKKLVPKESEESLPPVTYGSHCTFYPVTDTTLKNCPCGGQYTSDSEYTPRECCSGLYTYNAHYKWIDGRYTPEYTPAEVVDAKQNFYSGFEKPVTYDFNSDIIISITKNTTESSGFTIMPASQLRETQRDSRDSREDRTTQRDNRDSREDRTTQRDSRDSREDRTTQRDNRTTSRDYRDSREDRTTSRDNRDSREDRTTQRDYRTTSRDYRDSREDRTTQRDYRDSREDRTTQRDNRTTSRDYREDHRSRERDYVRNTRVTDEPNCHNGGRREPSKLKAGLDSELGKYSRKF
jgi:hypothetical protein